MKLSLIAFISLIVLVSGCIQQTPEQGEESTSSTATVTLVSYPSSVEAGEAFEVSWTVEGSGSITHTAVHWSAEGGKGEDFTAYENRSEIFTGNSPQTFTASLTAPMDSDIYFRGHAIVDEQHAYTTEQMISVNNKQAVEPEPEPEPETVYAKEFTIKAGESKYDPSSITVKKGDTITITFEFQEDDIYYGGLDIKSTLFETVSWRPGENTSKSVSFTATESANFRGYWPNTSKLKATGQINVVE